MDEKSIFNAARKISDEAVRDEYLELACGGDPDALNRIRELLSEDEDDSRFLEPPSVAFANTQNLGPELSRIGQRLGPYKLLQEIGEGGMGSVYMAEQEEPVRRRVALKIIKPGRADKQFVARFEAERQALALMEHPNIAKILDAGQAEDGAPYLVMELVQGLPITTYCDRNKLPPRRRLELFVPVCKAIQHAHQKGIIHRDLKPANVLVCIQDGEPVPKVIDFGLAKPLHHQVKLTEKTMFTEFGQVLGTIQYMSPEQAVLDALDVDTRSDVYSLGIVLYELLSGSTPVDQDTIKQNALLRVLEIIREQDPPLPSLRLSSSKQNLSSISEQRQIQPAKLEQILRNELDWIVMKALEKDRTRRYETANDFAEDVERYLNGDAVSARPPSLMYRASKFVKRHLGMVASAASIVFLLISGIILTTTQLFRAQKAEARANESYLNEKNARKAETDAKNAESEARQSAELDRLTAERKRVEAETAKYAMQLKLAALHQDDDNIPLALEKLNATNPELRQWEYWYLKSACDARYRNFGDAHAYFACAISPDGNLVAGGGKSSDIELFDFESGMQISALKGAWTQVTSLKFSHDGKLLAAATDRSVQVWDVASKKLMGSIELTDAPKQLPNFCNGKRRPAIEFDSSGSKLAIGLLGGIQVWDASLKNLLSQFALRENTFVQGLSFGIDDQQLAAEIVEKKETKPAPNSQDDLNLSVVFIDLSSGEIEERQIQDKYSSSTPKGTACFDPLGRWLVAVGQAESIGAIKRIDLEDGIGAGFSDDRHFQCSAPVGFSDARFSNDGSRFFVADHIKLLVSVVDCNTGQVTRTIRLPKLRVNFLNSISVSADGKRLVAGAGNDFRNRGQAGAGILVGFDLADDKMVQDISPSSKGQAAVNGIVINEEEGWVAKATNYQPQPGTTGDSESRSNRGVIDFHSLQNGELLFSLESQTGLSQVKSNGNATVFATSGPENTPIDIWDLSQRNRRLRISPAKGCQFWNRIAIDNTGERVAAFEIVGGDYTSGLNGKVVLLGTNSGQRLWESEVIKTTGGAGEFAFASPSNRLFFGIARNQKRTVDTKTGFPFSSFTSDIYIFDTADGRVVKQEPIDGLIHCARFDGARHVYFSGPFRKLVRWNLNTWELEAIGNHALGNICIFEDGKRLLGFDMAGFFPGQTLHLRCFDLKTLQETFQLPSPTDEFMLGSQLDITNHGECLVIGQVSKVKIIRTKIKE